MLESLESTVSSSLFWSMHGTGEWEVWAEDVGWLLGAVHVCGEQFGDAEEGRLCACSLCHQMPGLCRCRAVMEQL